MKPLIDYFERYWIRKMRWNLWNLYGVERRTNNFVEGNVFQFIPNLFLLIRMESSFQPVGSKISS